MKFIFVFLFFLFFNIGFTQKNLKIITKDFQSNEVIKYAGVEVYKGKVYLFSLKTDYNGFLIIDNLKGHDTLNFKIRKNKDECNCNIYEFDKEIFLDSVKLNDTIIIRIKGVGNDCINTKYFFYYHPFTIDCFNNQNSGNDFYQNGCVCMFDEKCNYLNELFNFLKCFNNLKIEIQASCSDKEYKEFGNQFNLERIQKIKTMFIENGLLEIRIKTMCLNNDKHFYNSEFLNKEKSQAEILKKEAKNTYVVVKVIWQ